MFTEHTDPMVMYTKLPVPFNKYHFTPEQTLLTHLFLWGIKGNQKLGRSWWLIIVLFLSVGGYGFFCWCQCFIPLLVVRAAHWWELLSFTALFGRIWIPWAQCNQGKTRNLIKNVLFMMEISQLLQALTRLPFKAIAFERVVGHWEKA